MTNDGQNMPLCHLPQALIHSFSTGMFYWSVFYKFAVKYFYSYKNEKKNNQVMAVAAESNCAVK